MIAAVIAATALAASGCKKNRDATSRGQQRSKSNPSPADKGGQMANAELKVATDIAERLARFVPTDIDFDDKLVDDEARRVLKLLVQAAQVMDDIFLDQVSRDNRRLRAQLAAAKVPKAALDYFDLMYGPWDRLQDDEPFIGSRPKPEGAGYYPPDLTRAELEAYIKANPKQAAALKSYFTVIRRDGAKLEAVPYSEVYRERLKEAADLLDRAAAQTSHPALRAYLNQRADALLSDDYFVSDLAWMDLGDSPIEVVIGPYEVYEDRLMGYKTAFEAFVTLRDPEFSARLQRLARHNQDVERNLPLDAKYATKRGAASPISVVIELFTGGDTRAGVQTAAFNLPNDERVRQKKGSKKVMLKNVTEAKFNRVLMPIARRVVDPALLERIDFETYFTDILLHEMAHGMGPGQIEVDGRQTSVNVELKELYTAIEECKADIVGLINGAFLVDKGALPKEMKRKLSATYLAGVFRAVRFGTEEAHGKAVLVAFNYLHRGGAITHDPDSGRFGIDDESFFTRARELAGELLLLQAKGSHSDAKALIEAHQTVTPQMKRALSQLKEIPVDIRPRYTILEKMKAW